MTALIGSMTCRFVLLHVSFEPWSLRVTQILQFNLKPTICNNGIGGSVKPEGLDHGLTSRRDIWQNRSPLMIEESCNSVRLGGCVQSKGKYSKLIYSVFKNESKVLPAVIWCRAALVSSESCG